MRNFIAVMFANEAKAYEGLQALRRLHEDARITVFDTAVVELLKALGGITTVVMCGAAVGMFTTLR